MEALLIFHFLRQDKIMNEKCSLKIICIICPVGCRITVNSVDDELIVTGNKCIKGFDFAKAEIESPVRSFSTTVRTIFSEYPVLPVKVNRDVPKEKIMDIICELSGIIITEKIGIGEIVAANIAGTGCDIIASSNILQGVKCDKCNHDCVDY